MRKLFFLWLLFTAVSSCTSDKNSDGKMSPIFLQLEKLNQFSDKDISMQISVLAKQANTDSARAWSTYSRAIEDEKATKQLIGFMDSINTVKDLEQLQKRLIEYSDLMLDNLSPYENVAYSCLSPNLRSEKSLGISNIQNLDATEIKVLVGMIELEVRNKFIGLLSVFVNDFSATSFKFDSLAIKVVSQSSTVKLGENFVADIFIAGMSHTGGTKFWIGDLDPVTFYFKGAIDSTSVKVIDGAGFLNVKATKLGENQVTISARVKNPVDGSLINYPCIITYKVVK